MKAWIDDKPQASDVVSLAEIKAMGIGGIHAEFHSARDAVEQMVGHIKDLEKKVRQLELLSNFGGMERSTHKFTAVKNSPAATAERAAASDYLARAAEGEEVPEDLLAWAREVMGE